MSTKNNVANVIFDSVDGNPIIDEDSSFYYVPYYKTREYFSVYENKVKFVKKVESLVRKHTFYKAYINFIVNVVGIDTCQVLSNIQNEEGPDSVTIEMHHGPMLTLFDTCMIVLQHLIAEDDPMITTFKVAGIVLQEHQLNNVGVTMLSKTVHQKIHDGESIFLNHKQAFGNTAEFLRKYKLGVDSIYQQNIQNYLDVCKEHDSFDNGLLEISEQLTEWGDNHKVLDM